MLCHSFEQSPTTFAETAAPLSPGDQLNDSITEIHFASENNSKQRPSTTEYNDQLNKRRSLVTLPWRHCRPAYRVKESRRLWSSVRRAPGYVRHGRLIVGKKTGNRFNSHVLCCHRIEREIWVGWPRKKRSDVSRAVRLFYGANSVACMPSSPAPIRRQEFVLLLGKNRRSGAP